MRGLQVLLPPSSFFVKFVVSRGDGWSACVCVELVAEEKSRRHLANAEATLLDRARTQARMADELMPMQARDGFDLQLLVEAKSHSDRYPVSHLHAAL